MLEFQEHRLGSGHVMFAYLILVFPLELGTSSVWTAVPDGFWDKNLLVNTVDIQYVQKGPWHHFGGLDVSWYKFCEAELLKPAFREPTGDVQWQRKKDAIDQHTAFPMRDIYKEKRFHTEWLNYVFPSGTGRVELFLLLLVFGADAKQTLGGSGPPCLGAALKDFSQSPAGSTVRITMAGTMRKSSDKTEKNMTAKQTGNLNRA